MFSTSAFAECSDSMVKRKLEQGKTITSIAKLCRMSKDDIRAIAEDDNEDDEPDIEGSSVGNQGLPSGTPLSQCNCWGYVNPGTVQQQPKCQSGYAQAVMCNMGCPAGGYAWQGVCS